MSRYRRSYTSGAMYFFTVALANRKACTLNEQIDALRGAYVATAARHPFKTLAICVLPSHLHALWALPPGDTNFSVRWAQIKSAYSRSQSVAQARSASKIAK